MPDIARHPGGRHGRCGAATYNGLVYAVATDTTSANGIAEQTRRALAELDKTLERAGSGKAGLLQATVYLNDMANKAEMDEVWCEWV